MKYRVLIAEDDKETADLLKDIFVTEGYEVAVAQDGVAALNTMLEFKPDISILDVGLPDMSGIEVCRQSREFTNTPVLMLTHLDDEESEDEGLKAGALNYILKPVRPKGLLTLVSKCLGDNETKTLAIVQGNLKICTYSRTVSVAGEEVSISAAIEFDVLVLLVENEGKIVTRDMFYQSVYNIDYDGICRNIDNIIVRLRKKLAENSATVEIKSVKGKGYLYAVLSDS